MEKTQLEVSIVDRNDYSLLENDIYLDYAGAGLPSKKMIMEIMSETAQMTFANPHSGGKHGDKTESIIAEARHMCLHFFGCPYDDYSVVFTSGATASLRLVGEIFPSNHDSLFAYAQNSHTSVMGIRTHFAESVCIPVDQIDQGMFSESENNPSENFNLLAISGECNATGRKLNLSTVSKVVNCVGTEWLTESGISTTISNHDLKSVENKNKWWWLLDATKLASSAEINIALLPHIQRPQFICASFYKMFGYPTGLGVLLVRKDCFPFLRKRYFGGGSVQAVAATSPFIVPKINHEQFEDGTLNYHAIAAIRHGFRYLEHLGGMCAVRQYTYCLTRYLYTAMKALQHGRHSSGGGESRSSSNSDGKETVIVTDINDSQSTVPEVGSEARLLRPLCTIYGYHHRSDVSAAIQGPVIAFTMQWKDGSPIGFAEVGRLAALNHIQLRTGCFCNIGSCQEMLHLSAAEIEENYHLGRVCSESGHDIINGKHTGAVRVSLGIASTVQDCDRFVTFLIENFLDRMPEMPTPMPPTSKSSSTSSSVSGILGAGFDQLFLYPAPAPALASSAAVETAADATISEEIGTTTADETESALYPPPLPPATLISRCCSKPILAAIFIYPIKSCGGIRVSQWPLCRTGLQYDREWAIIDDSGGSSSSSSNRVLTQKQYPCLALVQPVIDLQRKVMTVRTERMREVLLINITQPHLPSTTSQQQHDEQQHQERQGKQGKWQQQGKGEQPAGNCDSGSSNGSSSSSSSSGSIVAGGGAQVNVCGQLRTGRAVSTDADAWFSTYLSLCTGREIRCKFVQRLIYESTPHTSSSFPSCSPAASQAEEKISGIKPEKSEKPRKLQPEMQPVSFANTAQFLLLSAESVLALIEMMRASNQLEEGSLVTVENFRPNLLVIAGGDGAPHQEDSWTALTLDVLCSGGDEDAAAEAGAAADEKQAERQEERGQHQVSSQTNGATATTAAGPRSQSASKGKSRRSLTLPVSGPCSRCTMVNVNGKTGSMDGRAFQELSLYRKQGGRVHFGQFVSFQDSEMIGEEGIIELAIGTEIEVK